MQNPNIETAIAIYYSKLEIGTSDICDIFNCGRNTGLKLKNKARAEMALQNKKPFVANHVSTKIAFQSWGIDIADLEQRLKKMRQLGILKGADNG